MSVTNPSATDTKSGQTDTYSLWLSRILFVIAFVAQIVVAWHYWSLTWDDSAITLGFARTFAYTGRIEPTPGSGIVEGYSTTLWMLLMALAAKITSSPDTLLAVAKISTLLLNLVNLLLIRRWLRTWASETFANLIAGSIGCCFMFYETINGMETPLMMTLIFSMLLLYRRASARAYASYLVLGSLFLLCRWETAWLLVPFVLLEATWKRRIITTGTWFSIFAVSNLVRRLYFGAFLPNTITAKHGVPYTEATPQLELHRHTHELLGLFLYSRVLIFVFLLGLAFWYLKHPAPRRVLERIRSAFGASWQLRFTILFTVFALILTTAIGMNLGPQYRSFYLAWAFFWGLMLLPLNWPSVRSSPILPVGATLVFLVALFRMGALVREMNSPMAPVYAEHVSVGTISRFSTALAELQAVTHQHNIVFAGPDMGATMLYTNGVQVVDLGLLCNLVLAHQRYAAIEPYVLRQKHPDVIETHGTWTELSHFDLYPEFRDNYIPVYVDGTRLFLTHALVSKIDPSHLTQHDSANAPSAKPADEQLNHLFSSYLVLQ